MIDLPSNISTNMQCNKKNNISFDDNKTLPDFQILYKIVKITVKSLVIPNLMKRPIRPKIVCNFIVIKL